MTSEQQNKLCQLYDKVTHTSLDGIGKDAPMREAHKKHRDTVSAFNGRNHWILVQSVLDNVAEVSQGGIPSGHPLRKAADEIWSFLVEEKLVYQDDKCVWRTAEGNQPDDKISEESAKKVFEAVKNVCQAPTTGASGELRKALTESVFSSLGAFSHSFKDETANRNMVHDANVVIGGVPTGNTTEAMDKALVGLIKVLEEAGLHKRGLKPRTTNNQNQENEGMATKNQTELEAMKARDEQATKDAKFKHVQIVNQGDQIVLPEGMSAMKGIEWLRRRMEEDEQEVGINEPIEAYPLDGAHAFMVALKRKYGWQGLVPTPGFFGDKPPQMIGVECAPGETVQVPWGRTEIPGIAGFLQTGISKREGRFIFTITGKVKRKDEKEVAEIARLTREVVRQESIYRGKAIKVNLVEEDDESFNPLEHCPRFLDVSKVNENQIVLNETALEQVIDSLFTPIECTEACRKMGIPLKRGVLLEGPYGVGKSLLANITARKCVNSGWTFIYVSTVRQLQAAIFLAQQYAPKVVIFAEDIDRVVEGQERTDDIDAILNTIDGIDVKGSEIMVVLTTNHISKINKAMLRPGRLDAVISIEPPDAKSVERLILMYGGNLLETGADLNEVGEALQGQIPAVIEEVVKRAKLSAISSGRKDGITAENLMRAARGMLNQVALVTKKQPEDPTLVDKFADRLGRQLGKVLSNGQ